MRAWLIGMAALSLGTLTACDSDVPSPADRMNGEEVVITEVDPNLVSLRKDGLTAGSESFFFAAGQTEVNTALTKTLGNASQQATNEECGAGPMQTASYPGGLTVNFQNGNLVGWFIEEGSDAIRISGDVSLGMAREDVEAVQGYSPITDSTLGEEFIISGNVAGFMGEEGVSTLYAGVQCFFR